MRYAVFITILTLSLTSCSNKERMRVNLWNEFDRENHIKPTLSKAQFDSLATWDLGWFLLEPINIIKDRSDDEIRVVKRFSPGQKALHFIWYMDGQVTNGGFIQFYLNDYGKYIPAIIEGLTLIGDSQMIALVNKADSLYLEQKQLFDYQQERIEKEGWGNLYEDLKGFDLLDEQYYNSHAQMMSLLEKFARNNMDDFGSFN